MLPKDAEKHRNDAAADKQSRLDPHLREKLQKERVIPYDDDLFRDAAIEWLVSTDQVCCDVEMASPWIHTNLCCIFQPIQAFEHPAFQNMIHLAARATNGVKIPDRRQTREAIISTFKRQLTALRDRLNVCEMPALSPLSFWPVLQSEKVKGKVSLTCDAWQASNCDGYLAVTGSWIEEENGKWKLQTTLFGFTQLNNAHNGMRLGQALFKIVSRLRIAHKVSTVIVLHPRIP